MLSGMVQLLLCCQRHMHPLGQVCARGSNSVDAGTSSPKLLVTNKQLCECRLQMSNIR